jgi:hypothetical protein
MAERANVYSRATSCGWPARVACAGGLRGWPAVCAAGLGGVCGLGGGLLYVPVACDARRLAYSAVGWPATRRGWPASRSHGLPLPLLGPALAVGLGGGVANQPALMRRR